MNTSDALLPDDFKRVPGLFRRWELPEVLALCQAYRIEDAGCHADGTPLVALFTTVSTTKDAATSLPEGGR